MGQVYLKCSVNRGKFLEKLMSNRSNLPGLFRSFTNCHKNLTRVFSRSLHSTCTTRLAQKSWKMNTIDELKNSLIFYSTIIPKFLQRNGETLR